MLYVPVRCCGQDKWDVEGVRSTARGGDEAIPQKNRNGAAGARLSMRCCKLHPESVVEDVGVLGIRWIGYWGCSFNCARGRGAIPPKTRNGAAGARLGARHCKLHLESVVEDVGVLGIMYIGYWGC